MPHAAQTCIAKPALQAMGAFHFSSFLGTLSRSLKRVEQCRVSELLSKTSSFQKSKQALPAQTPPEGVFGFIFRHQGSAVSLIRL